MMMIELCDLLLWEDRLQYDDQRVTTKHVNRQKNLVLPASTLPQAFLAMCLANCSMTVLIWMDFMLIASNPSVKERHKERRIITDKDLKNPRSPWIHYIDTCMFIHLVQFFYDDNKIASFNLSCEEGHHLPFLLCSQQTTHPPRCLLYLLFVAHMETVHKHRNGSFFQTIHDWLTLCQDWQVPKSWGGGALPKPSKLMCSNACTWTFSPLWILFSPQ